MSRAASRGRQKHAAAAPSAPSAPIPAMVGAGARLLVAGALVAVWAAMFAPQLFAGKAFVLGDARSYRPYAEFSRARWDSLQQRTYWNPYVLAGIPASASLADSRPQYLPDPLLNLVERVRPGRWIPMGAPLLVHLAGMLAMAGLARAVAGAGPAGMVLAGAAWGMLPDLMVPYVFGHDAQLVTLSVLPLALLLAHRTVTAPDRPGTSLAAIGLSLVLGIQVLCGHPQYVVYTWLIGAPFVLVVAWTQRRLRRLSWVVAAALLAVLISAAVWWPAYLYGAHSFRGGLADAGVSFEEMLGYSMGVRDMLALGWPHAVGFGGDTYWGGMSVTDYPRFAGASVVALAIAALMAGAWRNPIDRLWIALAALGVLLALGVRMGFVHEMLTTIIPFGSRFRVSSAGLILTEFAIVMLAARAMGRMRDTTIQVPRWTWIVAGMLVVAGALMAVGPLSGIYRSAVQAARPEISGAVVLLMARSAGWDLALRVFLAFAAVSVLAVTLRTPRGPALAWLLAAIAIIDLGSVTMPFLSRATADARVLGAAPAPALVTATRDDPHARVWETRPIPSLPAEIRRLADPTLVTYTNDWIRWRARSLTGEHGAAPWHWRQMSRVAPTIPSVNALGVTYVSWVPEFPGDSTLFETIARTSDETVVRIRSAVGRAYFVSSVAPSPNDPATIDMMSSPNFSPRDASITTDRAAVGAYPGSAAATARWLKDDPDSLSLELSAPDRAFLVVADAYLPGWSATLDGRPVAIHRVNQIARGMFIPAGRHRLDLNYVPEGWVRGVALTRAGLLVWVLAAIAALTWSALNRRAPRPA